MKLSCIHKRFRVVGWSLGMGLLLMTIMSSESMVQSQSVPGPRICTEGDFFSNVDVRNRRVFGVDRLGVLDLGAYSGQDWIGPFPVISQNINFGGETLVLNRSSNDLERHAKFGDEASSLCVPAGWKVIFYEHADYEGASMTIEGRDSRRDPVVRSVSHLWEYDTNSRRGETGLHDRISSVKVYDADGRLLDNAPQY